MHEGDGPEFFSLLLGATFGMALMGSASNLLMLFLGAHWPSDVLGGWLLGSAWVTAATVVLLRMTRSGRPGPS